MKSIDEVQLTLSQRQALALIRQRIMKLFEICSIHLYGSVVRGSADEESDIDLLIITNHPLTRTVRHQITDIVFEINLQFNANFSTLVVDRTLWEEGIYSVLPIHDEILQEGIVL